jgi:hypothetical protein
MNTGLCRRINSGKRYRDVWVKLMREKKSGEVRWRKTRRENKKKKEKKRA